VRVSEVCVALSVLERFVRVRLLRGRAAEYFDMSSGAFRVEVRARYLAIADHYTALAEAELLEDRLERKRRLETMRSDRVRRSVDAQSQHAPQIPTRAQQPVKLRVIQGDGKCESRSLVRLATRSNLGLSRMAPVTLGPRVRYEG
jgi:hypothetical protein